MKPLINKRLINSPEWRKFLLNLMLFIGIVACIDFTLGHTLRYFYFQQKTGYQYRINYALNYSKADIFILGSSRASHHYDPQLITQKTGLKCYNAGENGMNLFYSSLVLHGILERNDPKLIVLELNIDEFLKSQVSYDRLSIMLPFYKDHPEFSEVLSKRSKLEKLKLVSQIYPFNSSILQIIYGSLFVKESRSQDIEGFIPLSGKWTKANDTLNSNMNDEIDTFKVRKFEEIIKITKAKKVNLLVAISPLYDIWSKTPKSVALAEKLCKRNDVPLFLQYQNQFFLNRPSLFKDPSHLNKTGATIFTNQLIDLIEKDKNTLVEK